MKNTCCFFGHRTINETEELKLKLNNVIEMLILNENVDMFLFGSKSRFDELCYEVVTKLKEKHSHIKRVYVRAEYPYITDSYKRYLLKSYEHTYYPENVLGAGKGVYVKRNYEMIDKSRFCVVYYDKNYVPATRKSGTGIAFDYAMRQKRKIINLM